MVAVNYRSKTDLVADAIKSMIQSGELASGDELHQRAVADKLGVSQTPVREALRRLEAEGFVAIEAHRPALVVRPDDAERHGNAMILGALEGLGAEMAAKKVTAGDIEALVDLNDRLAAADTLTQGLSIDRQFHLRICQITGYPFLISQLNLLWRMIGDGPIAEPSIDSWVAQHQEIIDALVAGDCSEARDTTKSHVLDRLKDYAAADS
ncbi:MAG TPA: GntR family transcriptional regulator [Acidimicrobiia bacterium]|nr:GntR family transcriptional regulator [Acidimicrobiia bacterium]